MLAWLRGHELWWRRRDGTKRGREGAEWRREGSYASRSSWLGLGVRVGRRGRGRVMVRGRVVVRGGCARGRVGRPPGMPTRRALTLSYSRALRRVPRRRALALTLVLARALALV